MSREIGFAADLFHLLLLEGPRSSFAREAEGHFGNLVEQQVPPRPVRTLPAWAPLGAGEGALLVAEQVALQQVVGNRRAVDRHEGPRPCRLVVDIAGEDFLPTPDSPVSSTVASVRATRAIWLTSVAAWLVFRHQPLGRRGGGVTYLASRSRGSKPWSMKSQAPPCAWRRRPLSTSPKAVINNTGGEGRRARIATAGQGCPWAPGR